MLLQSRPQLWRLVVLFELLFSRSVARQEQEEDELSLLALTDHRLCTYTLIATTTACANPLSFGLGLSHSGTGAPEHLDTGSGFSLEEYHTHRSTAAPSACAGATGVSAGRLEENLLLLLHRCYAAPVLLRGEPPPPPVQPATLPLLPAATPPPPVQQPATKLLRCPAPPPPPVAATPLLRCPGPTAACCLAPRFHCSTL